MSNKNKKSDIIDSDSNIINYKSTTSNISITDSDSDSNSDSDSDIKNKDVSDDTESESESESESNTQTTIKEEEIIEYTDSNNTNNIDTIVNKSTKDKNIVEKYIEINKQLIILISGLSLSGKTDLAKNIEHDFNIKRINSHFFCKNGYNNMVDLPGNKTINNYDTDEAIDYNRLNNEINKLSINGVIVSGVGFPLDKIHFKPDIHIHLNLTKQQYIKRRLKYRHDKKSIKMVCVTENNDFDEKTEKLIINQLTYPYYIQTRKRSKINRFIDIDNISSQDIYDISFDFIIKKINEYLK